VMRAGGFEREDLRAASRDEHGLAVEMSEQHPAVRQVARGNARTQIGTRELFVCVRHGPLLHRPRCGGSSRMPVTIWGGICGASGGSLALELRAGVLVVAGELTGCSRAVVRELNAARAPAARQRATVTVR